MNYIESGNAQIQHANDAYRELIRSGVITDPDILNIAQERISSEQQYAIESMSGQFDTEFKLDVTSRLFESKAYQVKINPERKILELDQIDPIESLEPSIQRLVQAMPKIEEFEGTIVDICSKIKLAIESP